MADLKIRAIPRSDRNAIEPELREGRVVVRVTAPPVDDDANEAIRHLIAKKVRVAPSRVTVVRGKSSKDKTLRIEGMDDATLKVKLGLEPRG